MNRSCGTSAFQRTVVGCGSRQKISSGDRGSLVREALAFHGSKGHYKILGSDKPNFHSYCLEAFCNLTSTALTAEVSGHQSRW